MLNDSNKHKHNLELNVGQMLSQGETSVKQAIHRANPNIVGSEVTK